MNKHETSFEFHTAGGLGVRVSARGEYASVRARVHRAPDPAVRLSVPGPGGWFDIGYGDDFELTVFGGSRDEAIARLEALRDACTRALEAAAQPAAKACGCGSTTTHREGYSEYCSTCGAVRGSAFTAEPQP